MEKRKTYSGSFKAKVISELILRNKNQDELAETYQLHPNLIKNWKTLLFKRAHIVFDDRRHNNKNGNFYEKHFQEVPTPLVIRITGDDLYGGDNHDQKTI